MMSDSDDTDVLLLIPPDLFVVPSSDSDDSLVCSIYEKSKSSIVSELIDQVQTLESRITAIESKDSSCSSLNLSRRLSLDSIMSSRPTFPKSKFYVNQNPNFQSTPTKYSHSLSLPSTPSNQQKLYHTNESFHTKRSEKYKNNSSNINSKQNKHDNSQLFLDPNFSQAAYQNKNILHVGNGCFNKESDSNSLSVNVCETNGNNKSHNSLPTMNLSDTLLDRFTSDLKPISDMSLPEVDECIRVLESTDKALVSRNDNYNKQELLQTDSKYLLEKQNYSMDKDERIKRKVREQPKIKFNINGYPSHELVYQSDIDRKKDMSDFTLPNDVSFSSLDTEKFMAEFKAWTPSFQHELNDSKISADLENYKGNKKLSSTQRKEINHQVTESNQNYTPSTTNLSSKNKQGTYNFLYSNLMSKITNELTKSQTALTVSEGNHEVLLTTSKSCPNIFKVPSIPPTIRTSGNSLKKTELSSNTDNGISSAEQQSDNAVKNETNNQRPHRLLTLSDFWSNNTNKTQEEHLRIKLEEERFRREHCEQMIHELQKKLLEQQEKVAVAIHVDNEKNSVISQFQVSWKKMKQRLVELESERENLQKILQNISEKHQTELADHQEQIKRHKEEISKALNLATGYKEKSECLVKEKLELLQSHAEELEGYKSLVQQAEGRYEEMKAECQKLLEKNQQTDETLKCVKQDLSKELAKSGEVRAEMLVIHKALDTCEAELSVLRQEKENLQLKLKEENSRVKILEEAKSSLLTVVSKAQNSEKLANNEVKSLIEQQERLRAEMRDVYQKQVDEVVKTKLQEFQTQLDSAETIFQSELETKQRAIAECAARKIKNVIDKHQLEVNLVEEKHKEEKRLYEIKLTQAMQKTAMLEAQINSYKKSKNQLVDQLHSMMQKQWQQALSIISGGHGDNASPLQKINVDNLLEFPKDMNLDLMSNACNTIYSEPLKLESKTSAINLQNVQKQENENESTLTSHDETPLTSKKESMRDLRKYIKMILDMQQSTDEYSKPKFFSNSPPSSHKESKMTLQKDMNTSNEGSCTWQPISEISIHDTSDYLSVPQKINVKGEQQRNKPPWK